MNNEKIIGSITLKQGLIIFASIIAIGLVVFGLILLSLLIPISEKVIDGKWETDSTTYVYVFEPTLNIYELEITFSFRDENDNELQTIVKKVGDVKHGQEYTVKIDVSELDNFATLIDVERTKLIVSNGKRKLT